jgi:hypothetical protein
MNLILYIELDVHNDSIAVSIACAFLGSRSRNLPCTSSKALSPCKTANKPTSCPPPHH